MGGSERGALRAKCVQAAIPLPLVIAALAVLGCSGAGPGIPDATDRIRITVAVTGPGTATVSPDGLSCGAGCAEYLPGTTVIVTPKPDTGLSVASWHGGGCEPSGDAPCRVMLSADTAIALDFCAYQIVADALAGDDAAAGICRAPFRTLTHALAVAQTGDSISLRPGRYDTVNGEVFPIVIPTGVEIIGNVASKGAGAAPVLIRGGDLTLGVAVRMDTLARLRGVTVRGDRTGIRADGLTVIQDDTIENCSEVGIEVAPGASDLKILDNAITDNAIGIAFDDPADRDGNATSAVAGNLIRHNDTGVSCAGDCGDLGGGAGDSAGKNKLICSTLYNLHLTTHSATLLVVAAKNNQWDAAPPSGGCGTTPADICVPMPQFGMVTVQGYSTTTEPCQ